jgi:hypothetical protein
MPRDGAIIFDDLIGKLDVLYVQCGKCGQAGRYRVQVFDSNVRFGSKADMCAAKGHVRFTPESGHVRCNWGCPLWANSGH